MVEQLTLNQRVSGSSPERPTKEMGITLTTAKVSNPRQALIGSLVQLVSDLVCAKMLVEMSFFDDA